jgi:hypothetical protein
VPGILADANIEGQFRIILRLLESDFRKEFWEALQWTTPTFADLRLAATASDLVVWQLCQQLELVLITANRNAAGPESLERTIREHNTPASLPVLTLANAERIQHEKTYAERVADQLLDYVFTIDKYRGTGRLYLP